MVLCQEPWAPSVRWRYTTPTARATCWIPAYPHYTDRTSQLMLMEIWRRGQTLQAFVALGKLVTPLQAASVAPDCAGGLGRRTQYRRITLCTLRHRSFSSRCVHSMTSRAPLPSCCFGNLGDHRYSGQGRCGQRAWWASGDPAPRQGPRQRPVTGRVQLQGAHPRRREPHSSASVILYYYLKQNTTTTTTPFSSSPQWF